MTIISQTITTSELQSVDYQYNYSDIELNKDWNNLLNATKYKKGSQFKPGMKLCQHFNKNFWDIEDTKGNSFRRAWQDYDLMDKVRLWGLKSMDKLWLSWIRRAVFMVAGLPNSSLYRPHFSKQIIEMTGKRTGNLFDPCAGWGGRMLGTVAGGWNYYSCEPNKVTYANLADIIKFIQPSTVVDIKNIPAESFNLDELDMVDVVLTSPPYFNLEVYNHDGDQSYNKYNTYDVWRDGWLMPLIDNCLTKLEEDGISAWNVMNFRGNDIVGDVIKAHSNRGWTLVDTVGFDSPLANIRKLKNRDVTYIFKKIK